MSVNNELLRVSVQGRWYGKRNGSKTFHPKTIDSRVRGLETSFITLPIRVTTGSNHVRITVNNRRAALYLESNTERISRNSTRSQEFDIEKLWKSLPQLVS